MKILPTGWDIYLTLFTASTFLRIALIVFAPQVNFRGRIPKLISFRGGISTRPPFGAMTRPIIGKVKKETEEEKK